MSSCHPITEPFDPFLHELLRKPEGMRSYLAVALKMFEEDGDIESLKRAIRTACEALEVKP